MAVLGHDLRAGGAIVTSMIMVVIGTGSAMPWMAAPIAIFMWWFVVMPKVMFDVWRPARREQR